MAIWQSRHAQETVSPATTYRVEHHEECRIAFLGKVEGAFPHHRTLEPFVSVLLRKGEDGELVLIDESTESIVARRKVRPFKEKPFSTVHRGTEQQMEDRERPKLSR